MANFLENIFNDILNSKPATGFVETMTDLQDQLRHKLNEMFPESNRIVGTVPKRKNPKCRYSIDESACSNLGLKCDMLTGRKPACQKNCPNNAIVWTGSHMEIDTDKCTNCGKCNGSCIHNAIELDGEPIGLTLEKAGRLLAGGAIKGVTCGIASS